MKIIFKIIEYLPESNQIIVKFCRQNAPKPIDDYIPVAINCENIDTSDRVNLIESLFQLGMGIIKEQEKNEPILSENIASEMFIGYSFVDFLNKIVVSDVDELKPVKSKRLKRIDIE